MDVYRSLGELALPASWVTIGTFDGLHLGHQALIREAVEAAHREGVPAVVVTFFPSPGAVLGKVASPMYLLAPEQKSALLAEMGVDVQVVMRFDHELSLLSAEQFVELLVAHLGMRHLMVGEDFALGHNREGNVPRLKELSGPHGFGVDVMGQVSVGGERASSSRVRKALLEGRVDEAAALLGRWYALQGKVIQGAHRGKSLGFPTANLDFWPEQMTPKDGIYASWVEWRGGRFQAATNVGRRPTFEDGNARLEVEAFLLDVDQDLYGQELTVEFVSYLRPEEKFPDSASLIAKMQEDVTSTREVLSHAANPPGLPVGPAEAEA
jgi:riboflavin kinase/FMN adenylyltransferase